jgi:DNA polymerase III epsilon subunit-like protein
MTTTQPAFIDFEASSLDLIASYPIEVGICMPDGSLHSWLIAPHVLWQDWSESAEQIHGITRETLEADGIAVFEVARALNELLPEQVFCDAWTFDSFWLHRLFRAARISPAFQLESISALLDTRQVRQWSAIRQQVITELGLPVHRAANDALILHKTWERIALDHEAMVPLTGQSRQA